MTTSNITKPIAIRLLSCLHCAYGVKEPLNWSQAHDVASVFATQLNAATGTRESIVPRPGLDKDWLTQLDVLAVVDAYFAQRSDINVVAGRVTFYHTIKDTF